MSDGTTVRLPRLIGLSRALDLLLTGRSVAASEALEIGLANRLVERGQAVEEALRLAATLAAFPQEALLADRRSALRQFDLPLDVALRQEAEMSVAARRKASEGARRFVAGEGRHGESA